MSKENNSYYFIPDYFIIDDGKKIGKQDPGYNELVAKYCRKSEGETSKIESAKEVNQNESKES